MELSELDKLKKRLDITSPEEVAKLKIILEDAEADVLDYCRRDDIVGNMRTGIRKLAIVYWNRQGTEGEEARSEGGVSQNFEMGIPKDIQSSLQRNRKGKVRRF